MEMATVPPAPPPAQHLHARKLSLHLPPAPISSLLFDHHSETLAVVLSDSSAIIFLNPLASGTGCTPTSIPSPLASSATFFRYHSRPSSSPIPFFLCSSPSLSCSTSLHAYSILTTTISPVLISPSSFPSSPFGLGVRLAGGTNVLVFYSIASQKIWVLGAFMDGSDKNVLELKKCAVVEMDAGRAIYDLKVSGRWLLLAEFGGVRVFSLHVLMKGKTNKDDSGRLITRKFQEDSGTYFLLKTQSPSVGSETIESTLTVQKSLKAVSVHPLSKNKFLVLDSAGKIHFLSLHGTTGQQSLTHKVSHMNPLHCSMEVHSLAILPSASAKEHTLWLSDGRHSVHIFSLSSDNGPVIVAENDDCVQRLIAKDVIFMSEMVMDVVPLSQNDVLIFGQGSFFVYRVDRSTN